MKLEDYQVDWLKKYFIKHMGGKPKFNLSLNGTMFRIVYDIENDGDVLASSDMVLDLIKYGFHLPFFGVITDDKKVLEFGISTPDEWVELVDK